MKNDIETLEENGLTYNQLLDVFGNQFMAAFKSWMKGQTIMNLNGKDVYYYYDIARFVSKHYVRNKEFALSKDNDDLQGESEQ